MFRKMSTLLFFNKNNIYLEAFRMSAKQLQLFSFSQLQNGIQLTGGKLFA